MRFVLARQVAARDARGSARFAGTLSATRAPYTAAAGVHGERQAPPRGEQIQHVFGRYAITPVGASTDPATVQRKEETKAKSGVADATLGAAVTATINVGLAKVDETLLAGARQVRLAVRTDAEFARAWDDYADRSGTPGARMEAGLNGFVDPTHPDGKTGFVRASAGMGTAIHEAMHLRAAATFSAATVGRAVNEGTTELFTRVVIGYGGGTIPRAVYDKEYVAMLRCQGITGLTAVAQWFFKGDSSAVEKALGRRFRGFMDFMRADDPDSAIQVL